MVLTGSKGWLNSCRKLFISQKPYYMLLFNLQTENYFNGFDYNTVPDYAPTISAYASNVDDDDDEEDEDDDMDDDLDDDTLIDDTDEDLDFDDSELTEDDFDDDDLDEDEDDDDEDVI